MNLNPLGCGALAGTRKVIDRGRIAELLGFDGPVDNAYDTVSLADHFSRAAGVADRAMTRKLPKPAKRGTANRELTRRAILPTLAVEPWASATAAS
jgi:hypothetical protein